MTDGGNNRVLRCSALGTNWNVASVFASGNYDGLPLTEPTGLAQDAVVQVFVYRQRRRGGRTPVEDLALPGRIWARSARREWISPARRAISQLTRRATFI